MPYNVDPRTVNPRYGIPLSSLRDAAAPDPGIPEMRPQGTLGRLLDLLPSGQFIDTPTAGGPPLELSDLINIPQSKRDAIIQSLMFAAPVIGQAAWRARGIPKATIEALKATSDPINARNLVYHATSPEGMRGILEEGAIHPFGAMSNRQQLAQVVPDAGVSVSRVPRMASKADKAITLALDAEKMPPSRPFAEGGYEKTRATAPTGKELAWYEQNAPGTLETIRQDAQKPNPHFEFENRTYNQPVPLSGLKEVLIDKEGLARAGYGGAHRKAALIEDAVEEIAAQAAERGVPVRVFNTGRELHSYRAGMGTPSTAPWQIPASKLIRYEDTRITPRYEPITSGGYSEAEMHARSLANRAAEEQPPIVPQHPVGSWGTDSTGELAQLREYSLDNPRLHFPEGRKYPGDPTVQKYAEWIRQGSEPPPMRALETDKGTIRIQDGHHRAEAIRQAGGNTAKVWVSITRNRPLGNGEVMPEGRTHRQAVEEAIERGYRVPAAVLMDYLPK